MWWAKLVQTIFTSGSIELEHIVSNCHVGFSENNLKQRNIGRTSYGTIIICRTNYHCGILLQAFKNEGTLWIGPKTGVKICTYVTKVTHRNMYSHDTAVQM